MLSLYQSQNFPFSGLAAWATIPIARDPRYGAFDAYRPTPFEFKLMALWIANNFPKFSATYWPYFGENNYSRNSPPPEYLFFNGKTGQQFFSWRGNDDYAAGLANESLPILWPQWVFCNAEEKHTYFDLWCRLLDYEEIVQRQCQQNPSQNEAELERKRNGVPTNDWERMRQLADDIFNFEMTHAYDLNFENADLMRYLIPHYDDFSEDLKAIFKLKFSQIRELNQSANFNFETLDAIKNRYYQIFRHANESFPWNDRTGPIYCVGWSDFSQSKKNTYANLRREAANFYQTRPGWSPPYELNRKIYSLAPAINSFEYENSEKFRILWKTISDRQEKINLAIGSGPGSLNYKANDGFRSFLFDKDFVLGLSVFDALDATVTAAKGIVALTAAALTAVTAGAAVPLLAPALTSVGVSGAVATTAATAAVGSVVGGATGAVVGVDPLAGVLDGFGKKVLNDFGNQAIDQVHLEVDTSLGGKNNMGLFDSIKDVGNSLGGSFGNVSFDNIAHAVSDVGSWDFSDVSSVLGDLTLGQVAGAAVVVGTSLAGSGPAAPAPSTQRVVATSTASTISAAVSSAKFKPIVLVLAVAAAFYFFRKAR